MGASDPGTGEYSGADPYDDPSADFYEDPTAYTDQYQTDEQQLYPDDEQQPYYPDDVEQLYPQDGQPSADDLQEFNSSEEAEQTYPGASAYHNEYTYAPRASNAYAPDIRDSYPEQEQHPYYTGPGAEQIQDDSGEVTPGAYPNQTYDAYPAHGAATDGLYDQTYDSSAAQDSYGKYDQNDEQSFGEDDYSHGGHQQGYGDASAPSQEMHTAVQAY
jgi:hypothetical protein